MAPSTEDRYRLPRGYQVGEYRLVEFLRAEDFGDVYSAEHAVLGRAAEIKFIWDTGNQYYVDALPSALINGAKLLARLSHPNVAAIDSAGEIEGRTYVVRRTVAGTRLGDYVERGIPSLDEGLRILESIASALEYCHQKGVIHRNLKPGTIFLDDHNQPVLSDFTIAVLEASRDNPEHKYVGTPGFMSPEQWRNESVTRAMDIWGFGAVAYYLFSGKSLPPSLEESNADWSRAVALGQSIPDLAAVEQLPSYVLAIISRCLKIDPNDRWQSSRDLRLAIQAARDGVTRPGPREQRVPAIGECYRLRSSSSVSLETTYDFLEIISRLGEGSFGLVYGARNIQTDAREALKILKPEWIEQPDVVARFEREATILEKLRHPNVVGFYRHGMVGRYYFLSMEWLDGRNLKEQMDEQRQVSAREALIISRDVFAGLAAIHAEDIIHRDIKPSNIYLAEGHAKLCDFGIARAAEMTTVTATGEMLGTPAYMAPEVAAGCAATTLISVGTTASCRPLANHSASVRS